MGRNDNLFIESDLARCVSALRGLTGLLRAPPLHRGSAGRHHHRRAAQDRPEAAVIDWQPSEINETLRPIAEHISVAVAEAFVREFGGMRLLIPVNWREDHILNALGEETARLVIAEFAGELITVPRSVATQAARIGRARQMRGTGATVNEIARALGLSHRAAQEHVAGRAVSVQPRRRPKDERQIDIEDILRGKPAA